MDLSKLTNQQLIERIKALDEDGEIDIDDGWLVDFFETMIRKFKQKNWNLSAKQRIKVIDILEKYGG